MAQTTQTETYPQTPTLYIATELSSKKWKLASSAGGRTTRERTIDYGDRESLRKEVERSRQRFELPKGCRVLFCQEAGRDGFWIHRMLEEMGFESLVIDPASVNVPRKARRAKTDRLDALLLLRELVRYDRYDSDAWSVVRVPSREDEDARRPIRELGRLTKERSQHVTRIKSLLCLHGVKVSTMPALELRLARIKTQEGAPLPMLARAEIERELARWRLVMGQIRQIETEQQEELQECRTKQAVQMRQLLRLRGIGKRTSAIVATELFGWRTFRNRREVGACVGLCGSPYNSGNSEREQGITKAGNARLRALMIEAAWSWVRWQPDSDLTEWFQRRFAGDARRKKAGIVAVARKLLIQLWHYLEHDVVPKNAIIREA